MQQLPCRVEHDTAYWLRDQDARDAEREAEAQREREVLASIRASMLAGLLSGDFKAPVKGLDWKTGDINAQPLDCAIGDVYDDDGVMAAVCKLLATDSPEAKAARDAIAAKYVERFEGWTE
jgi:hypothetical protein